MDIERQRDILMKDADNKAAQLNRNYERELEILKEKAANLKSTCEHIVHQRQQEARVAKEELEVYRDQLEWVKPVSKHLLPSIDNDLTVRSRKH